jgi:hypothetical protein
VELFGPERAFDTITTRDLIELGGEDALKKGGIRCLPEKDASGRGIVVIDRTRFDQRISSRMHMVRNSSCLSSCLLVSAGRVGVVVDVGVVS